MGWLERGADKRADPDLVLPGARTMVMLGVNYRGAADAGGVDEARPVWARYALNDDYHDTIRAGLAAAGRVLEELGGIGPADHRYYVDTGPVLERGWAARAGVGFTGKNAMLISREFGNWLFLACIVTRLEIPADAPLPGREIEGTHAGRLCGAATRQKLYCPEAIHDGGLLDALRHAGFVQVAFGRRTGGDRCRRYVVGHQEFSRRRSDQLAAQRI
jgi:epoxyqueuosine reductase